MQGNNEMITSKAKLAFSMAVFGTIGLFVRSIPFSSSFIAMARGFLGVIFLLLLNLVRRKRIDFVAVRKNIIVLLLSGAAIGVNWILLFEAYNYTSVATATLCYYLAPIFITLASPFVLREKLTAKKLFCVLCALLGMVFVSGVFESGGVSSGDFIGILLATGAAVFYSSVMLLNKKLRDIGDTDRTVFQLLFASSVAAFYVFSTQNVSEFEYSARAIILLLVVGFFHTGFAYTLYFGSVGRLPAQTTALLCYIDPVVAIILSAVALRERLTVFGIIGAVLILGSTLFGEIKIKLPLVKRKKK